MKSSDNWISRGRPAPAAPALRPAALARPARTQHVRSPLVGFVHGPLKVSVGDVVKQGQPVCVIRQLGAEHLVRSAHTGRVLKVYARPHQAAGFGDPLLELTPL